MSNIGIDAGILEVSKDSNRYNDNSTLKLTLYKNAKVYCPIALNKKEEYEYS
jgi:hypothetical protein